MNRYMCQLKKRVVSIASMPSFIDHLLSEIFENCFLFLEGKYLNMKIDGAIRRKQSVLSSSETLSQCHNDVINRKTIVSKWPDIVSGVALVMTLKMNEMYPCMVVGILME